MANALGLFQWELTVQDATGYPIRAGRPLRFNPLGNGVRQRVTLTASVYTALSVPTGAQFMAVILGTATSLTLKGNTGDVGIPILPSSNPAGFDLLVPLATGATPGFLNGLASNQVVDVIFV